MFKSKGSHDCFRTAGRGAAGVAAVLTLGFGPLARGDAIALAPYAAQTTDIASGTVVQEAPVRLAEGSVLDKTGAGTWSIPAGQLYGREAVIGVRAGALAFTSGGASAPAKPTAVLNRAALWLDATSANVITTNAADGTAYVTEWRDVRETKSSVPYDYLRALPRYTSSVETWATNAPPVVRQDAHGSNVVYFGRYRSGRWMALADKTAADGTSPFKLTGIRHAFIVYRALDNYWFLMGMSTSGAKQCWHPFGSAASLATSYCANNYEDDTTLPTKRHYLNGTLIDPWCRNVYAGACLLEHHYTVTPGFADSLANCQSITGTSAGVNRMGGDDYCEIILFTEELSEAERVSVEDYLMAKWSLAKEEPRVCVETVAGTTVSFQDGTVPHVTGSGTLQKDGSGHAVILSGGDDAVRQPTLSFSEGSVTIRDEVPLSVAHGKTIAAVRAFDGTETSLSEAAAQTIVKTGEGRLRLESVPSGTAKLSVSAGELTLGVAGRAIGLKASPSAEGSMDSPGFEGAKSGANWGIETEQSQVGWHYARDPDEALASVDYYAGICNGTLWDKLVAYSGTCFGQIRGLAYLYTDVEIPEDGFYELSFQFAQRNEARSYVDVLFGPAESLQTVARVFNTFATSYRKVTVSLPYAKKGTARLRFHGIGANTQSSGVIDDVKIVRCAREEAVVKVPYGDFEVTASRGYNSIVDKGTPIAADAPEGWTITPAASDYCTAAIIGATNSDGRTYSLACGRPGGRAQLILATSTPTASTTFTPEAFGRFCVRADIGRYGTHALFAPLYGSETPQVHVIATVKGVATDLGALSSTEGIGQLMRRAICPTAFEIPSDATSVTLTLSNNVPDSIAFLDNVELVRADGTEEEFVKDGSFEADGSPDWTFVRGPKYTNGAYGEYACRLLYGSEMDYQGRAQYAGSARLRLWNTCWAYQPIVFEEAGDYLLRFHSAMRMDNRYEPGRKGYEPYCAYLAADGVTNVIGKALSTTTNYIAQCWRFRVDKPGTYDFGFWGSRRPDEAELATADRTAFIDGVSIRRVSDDEAATPELPETLTVEIAEGAQLRLDFAGTNRVDTVRIGGRRVSGIIDAARFPGQIFGTGALYAERKGLQIIIR